MRETRFGHKWQCQLDHVLQVVVQLQKAVDHNLAMLSCDIGSLEMFEVRPYSTYAVTLKINKTPQQIANPARLLPIDLFFCESGACGNELRD